MGQAEVVNVIELPVVHGISQEERQHVDKQPVLIVIAVALAIDVGFLVAAVAWVFLN